MPKSLKILIAVICALAILLFVLAKCGVASSIAESVVKKQVGCDIEISGLHVRPGLSLACLKVSVDSIRMSQDSLDVRLRGIKLRARLKKDSVFAYCSSRKSYLRFGSNRLIVNDLSLLLGLSLKDTAMLGTQFSLKTGESKFISTLFPLQTRLSGLFVEKSADELYINDISAQSGTTDVKINGSASNLAAFISGDGELESALTIKSDNVNVNEILAGIYYGAGDPRGSYPPSEEEDETFIEPEKYVRYPFLIKEIIPLLIPERLKVAAELNVGKARVSVLRMSDFSAHLDVLDKTAKVSKCKFNSNFGNASTTLFYSSPSKDNLLAGADLKLSNLTAREITALIPQNDNISPLLNSFKGKFNCQATMTSQVDTAFIPIYKTMKGVINFQGHGMSITDAGNLRKYTSLLLFRNKNIGNIDDVNMYVIVSDNNAKVFPMTIGVDRYLLAMSGSHSFKNRFNYDLSIIKSPLPFKFGISLHNAGGKSKVKFKLKKPTYETANLPKFYNEVSNTQLALSRLIDNVLDEGANEIHIKSSHVTKDLLARQRRLKYKDYAEPEKEMRDSVFRFFFFGHKADSLKAAGHIED